MSLLQSCNIYISSCAYSNYSCFASTFNASNFNSLFNSSTLSLWRTISSFASSQKAYFLLIVISCLSNCAFKELGFSVALSRFSVRCFTVSFKKSCSVNREFHLFVNIETSSYRYPFISIRAFPIITNCADVFLTIPLRCHIDPEQHYQIYEGLPAHCEYSWFPFQVLRKSHPWIWGLNANHHLFFYNLIPTFISLFSVCSI